MYVCMYVSSQCAFEAISINIYEVKYAHSFYNLSTCPREQRQARLARC